VILSRGETEAAKAVSAYLGSIQTPKDPKDAGAGSGGSGDKSQTPAPAALAGSGDTIPMSTPAALTKGKGRVVTEESRRIREAMSEARDPLSEGALLEMVRKIAEQNKK
jgi:hypothetical protein